MPSTTNYGWNYPTVGADLDVWGDELNATIILIDAEMFLKANKASPTFTGTVTITGSLTVSGAVSFGSIVSTGNITAPAFIGTPSAILRPTVDSATAIQFQNVAGVSQAWIDTTIARLSVSGSITTPIYLGGGNVQLRPLADNTAAIQFQNSAGTQVAWVDTTNQRLGCNTYMRTLVYEGNPGVNIRPLTNSASAIQLQDAAGNPCGSIDTTLSRLSMSGSILSPVYLGNPVVLRPTVDSTSAIQFQNAAGTIMTLIDTSNGRMSIANTLGVAISGPDPAGSGSSLTVYKNNGNTMGAMLYNGGNSPVYLDLRNSVRTWKVYIHADGAQSFQIYDETGAYTPLLCAITKVIELKDNVIVGAGGGTRGTLVVNNSRGYADSGINATIVAKFQGDANNVIELGSNAAAPGSGKYRGIMWSYATDDFHIVRYPTGGGGPITKDFTVTTDGYVGLGQSIPTAHLHVLGTGTAETVVFTPSSNIPNTIFVQDAAGAPNNGGAIAFGTSVGAFAAIRVAITNGSGYGVGYLKFFTRTSTANSQLSEIVRFYESGAMAVHAMPTAYPGAGSNILWCDTTDSNRVKWAN